MWYIIAFFSLLLVSLLDGHTSSLVALSFMFVMGVCSVVSIKQKGGSSHGEKVFGVIFSVYVISAFIASQSFLNGQYFYVVDSMKYIADYSNTNSWSWDETILRLAQTYLFFVDDNGLYNEGLSLWAYVANHYFDGATVLYMTLLQTLFGFLATLEIYKIYLLYIEPGRAAKYACLFALLSLFHIYSIVVIRDIVIAYFYMLGLRKVMGRPKFSDVFILLIIMVITMGIRLYTGLFFGVFIMLWVYKLIKDKKYARLKIIIIPILIVGVAFVGAAIASSVLVEATGGQVEEYDELYAEGGGTAAKFRSLPIGVSQIVILFFSQLPLDNLERLSLSNSFSNYYLTFLAIVYEIFGFVIFYGLMFLCFIKGYFKKMELNDKLLLIIMLLFIALNLSTHIDVRRCMEAIPFVFLYYILASEQYGCKLSHKLNKTLVALGVLMMIAYSIVS